MLLKPVHFSYLKEDESTKADRFMLVIYQSPLKDKYISTHRYKNGRTYTYQQIKIHTHDKNDGYKIINRVKLYK